MCAFKLPIVCATDVDARVAIDLGLARGLWLVVRRSSLVARDRGSSRQLGLERVQNQQSHPYTKLSSTVFVFSSSESYLQISALNFSERSKETTLRAAIVSVSIVEINLRKCSDE